MGAPTGRGRAARRVTRSCLAAGLALGGAFWLSGLRLPTGFFQSRVHAQSTAKFWVFDAHMHPTATVYHRGGNIGDSASNPQFSLPMARKGGLGAAFVNTSVDEFYEANHIAVRETLREFDHFYQQIALFPNDIGVARNLSEVRALQKQGKIAAILSIEGALAIESDLGVLRMFHRLGLREMNLVHLLENNIGDVMHSPRNGGKGYGLTPFGKQLVAEMNRLGIVIDLAHTAEQTVADVIEASTQPVMTTHSAARAIVDAPGTWSDDLIRKLTAKGGVICVPFLPQIVSQEYHDKYHKGRIRGSGLVGLGPLTYAGDPTKIYEYIEELRRKADGQRGENASERARALPPLSNLIDQIDYIAKLVGVDSVGISSDWGGYPVNVQGIQNAGEYQNVAQALLQRGYSDKDVAKIMGENVLRVFDRVVSGGVN